jgi:hypothetical protein
VSEPVVDTTADLYHPTVPAVPEMARDAVGGSGSYAKLALAMADESPENGVDA